MAQRPIGVTDVASGAGVAQFRTRERTVASEAVVEQYLIPINERVVSARCSATTFRTVGVASVDNNLACLFNKTGSGVLVAVRRLTVQQDATSNSGTVRAAATSRITTAPTDGTLLTPVVFDSATTHDADVEFRGATASDGGAATTLTATPGTRVWSGFQARNPSLINRRLSVERTFLPTLSNNDPPYLREGEGLLVTNTSAASASTFFIVNVVWEEFLL